MKLNYLKSKWVAMITILFLACSVQAQNKIFVDVNASLGMNDGSSWADAFTDLQVGIDAASASDSVFVAKGEYQPAIGTAFMMKEGVKIYGSFQGTETSLTNRIFGTNIGDTSVLKGNGIQVIINASLTAASELDGFKITNGNGGMKNNASSPILRNLTVCGNVGVGTTGGILNEAVSSPMLLNVTISGNSSDGIGGGMFNSYSSPTLINVVITGNTSLSYGGGIANDHGNPNLTNVTIAGNSGAIGGALYNYNSTSTIKNSIILGNNSGITASAGSAILTNSLVQEESNTSNGNIDFTGITSAAVFVNPLPAGLNTGGDYSLKTCGPVVNMGSNALVPASATTDIAGNARIFNTTVDMGAYELIYSLITSTIDTTRCGNLILNSQTYTTSGTYTQVLTAANGCDSTITINATIKQPSFSTTNVTTCDSLRWNGVKYTLSGTYTHIQPNKVGCDSTATLNLIINNNGSTLITSSCDSLRWNGVKYTTSGTYTFTGTNIAGCDSIATLVLTITNPTTSITNYTECTATSYTWNTVTYTVPGTYTYSTTNLANCDSTATLNLKFGTPSTSTTTKSACNSFLWNGTTRTSSGTYTFNTTNAAGCDSTATLFLTIGNTLTASVTIVNQNKLQAVSSGSNLTYRWIDCDLDAYIAGATNSTLDVTRNGKYAVEVTDGICKTKSACVNMTQAGVNENDALNLGITVYPNPTSGIVTIKIANNQQADVHVYDASGKIIKTYLNLNSDDTISIEEFTTGVYTLQIQTQAGIKMERLMKN